MIDISESAQSYLAGLLSKQEDEGVAIRVFVAQPGTPNAETCIAYCRPGEEQEGDIAVQFDGFTAWFEERSQPYLVDAKVDYAEDKMGGQLTIKLPTHGCRVSVKTRRWKIASITSCLTRLIRGSRRMAAWCRWLRLLMKALPRCWSLAVAVRVVQPLISR